MLAFIYSIDVLKNINIVNDFAAKNANFAQSALTPSKCKYSVGTPTCTTLSDGKPSLL